MAESTLPDGIEKAIRKAQSDASFRKELLRDRADAAAKVGIHLEPAESEMLSSIPVEQLEAAIESSKPPSWRNRPETPSPPRRIMAYQGTRPGIPIGGGGTTSSPSRRNSSSAASCNAALTIVLLLVVLLAVIALALAIMFT
jgi:hypothetical protein